MYIQAHVHMYIYIHIHTYIHTCTIKSFKTNNDATMCECVMSAQALALCSHSRGPPLAQP